MARANVTALGPLLLAGLVGSPALAQEAPVEPAPLAGAEEVERDLRQLIDEVSQAFVAIGGGSGVIVSPEGDVITNHHVAGSKDVGETWVVTRPGRVFEEAVMIGTDPYGDIAHLKLKGKGPYPYVPFGDSDAVKPGQGVIALGNPFGFSKDGTPNVSAGVVSAVHRFQGGYSDAIMTDASVNPGNSGGPLIDMQGRMVGINGKIAMRWGNRANSGVGYAIPANQIQRFMPHFRERGLVRHGQLKGVRLRRTSDEDGRGAVVSSVNKQTPAWEAGLRQGDVVLRADGRDVHSRARLFGIVGSLPGSESITLEVERDGDVRELAVQLSERAGVATKLGLTLSDYEQDGERGAVIEKVKDRSAASRSDLQPGDVILEARLGPVTKRIRNTRSFEIYMDQVQRPPRVTFTVLRGEEKKNIQVTLRGVRR